MHKNTSRPLTTSADGSAPANPASAASTVRLEALVEEMLGSWYSKEPKARHQCHGRIDRLRICFCNFHGMLNHGTVCFFAYVHTCRQLECVLTSLCVVVIRFSAVLMSMTFSVRYREV